MCQVGDPPHGLASGVQLGVDDEDGPLELRVETSGDCARDDRRVNRGHRGLGAHAEGDPARRDPVVDQVGC